LVIFSAKNKFENWNLSEVAAAMSGFTFTNEDDDSEVVVEGYTNHLGEMITTDHYYYNARFKEGEFIGNVFYPF
jgi:hypothetical protein